MPRKRVDSRKLHAKLAEIDNLKIYRVKYYPGIGPKRGGSRCIACATEPRSMVARMKDPDNTTGRPIGIGYWLINTDTQEVMGPFGKECGFRAVMNSWLKPRREAMRQQLLAAGVPSSEIEERLQQFAHDEWNRMLRVYMKAEREAKKLGIDTTTLTYDEIVAAIAEEQRKLRLERAVEHAKVVGLEVQPSINRTFFVRGTLCETAEDVYTLIEEKRRKDEEERRRKAEEARKQNQARFKPYVEFIEWVFDPSHSHGFTSYEIRDIEKAQIYINQGNPFPQTLQRLEMLATRARGWGWTGQLGQVATPPVASSPTATGQKLPPCPICGGELIRKSGYSKVKGKHYDFWGCKAWTQTRCKGAMQIAEYNRQLAALNPQLSAPQPSPPPQQAVHAPKAVAAARAQVGQNQPYPLTQSSCPSCGKMWKLCRCGGVATLKHLETSPGRIVCPDTSIIVDCPDPGCVECERIKEKAAAEAEPSTEPKEQEVEQKRTKKAKEAFKERQKRSFWKM